MIIFGYKFERAHFERSHTPRPTKIQKSERAKEGRARAVLRGTFANRLLRVEFVLSPARGFLSSRERFFLSFSSERATMEFFKARASLGVYYDTKSAFLAFLVRCVGLFGKSAKISVFCRAKQLRFLQRFLSRDTDFKRVKFVLREKSHCVSRGGGRVTAPFVFYKHRTFWHVSLSPSLSRLAALLYSYT